MVETSHKTDGHENRSQLPGIFGAAFLESAETILEAQAGLLLDLEETVVTSLHRQQETVQKVLELMDGMRNANSLADHMKMQLAASEQCLTYGLNVWSDTANLLSQKALKRLESGNRAAMSVAGLGQRMTSRAAGEMKSASEKAGAAMKSAGSRAAEAA